MSFWLNTMENGLANGTVMTGANSGGTAGNQWNSTQKSGAATLTTTTTAISGTRSLSITTASGEFGFILVGGYATKSMSMAAEFDCAELVPSVAARIFQITGGVAAVGVRLFVNADRTLLFQTNGGGTLYTSAALPTTGKVTINVSCTAGTSAATGTARLAYYLGASTTPAQTPYYGTGKDTGAGGDFFDARMGKVTASTWASTIRLDNMRVYDSSDQLLGPSGSPPPLAGTLLFTLSQPAPPCTLTMKVIPDGGTAPYLYGPVTDWGLGDGSTSPQQSTDTFTKQIPAGAPTGVRNVSVDLTGS